MVLEALAAISLTGNVVQFVHFSCALLSKSQEIYHSTSGSAPQNDELKVIAQQLKAFTQTLQPNGSTGASGPHGPAAGGDEAVAHGVHTIATHCQSVAAELLSAIAGISARQGSGRSEKWPSFRKALKSIWRKERIAELQNRLESLRDQLAFHLVSQISNRQTLLNEALNTLLREDNARNSSAAEEIQSISEKLALIDQGLRGNQDNAKWEALRNQFSELSSIISEMSKGHVILRSLRYAEMRVRHSAIADAHKQTFDWIFATKCLPENDPRSSIKFTEWSENGSGIFWVSGKPGSGKSTLMKYLEDSHGLDRALQKWTKSAPLLTASFYFWKPGTAMQKSLQGLLQSLLYRVLNVCPDLIPIVCKDRWNCSRNSIASSDPWTIAELRESFLALRNLHNMFTNFYFQIDGLDEYDGSDDEVIAMIAMLKDMASAPNIKVCLSSRPLNCFESEFGSTPFHKLYLHTLTTEDIELFAHEQLMHEMKKMHVRISHQSCKGLIEKIVSRAQGVFLWVRLVVRSLCVGFRNEDPITLLHARLDSFPTELGPFFQLIFNSVDPVYRKRMATAFLVALETDNPLKMIDYSFLEELDDHPNLGLELSFSPIDDAGIHDRVTQTSRRLYGRYKGLLEPSRPGRTIRKNDTVDFLHRTLRDYLEMPDKKNMLWSRVSQGFDPADAIMRVLLAEAKMTHGRVKFRNFRRALQFSRKVSKATRNPDFEFSMLDHIEQVVDRLYTHSHAGSVHDLQGSMLKTAIHAGRNDYVEYRLVEKDYAHEKNSLLKHALLCPRSTTIEDTFADTLGSTGCSFMGCFLAECHLDPLLIRGILESGANPNATCQGVAIWPTFLRHSLIEPSWIAQDNWHSVFDILLHYGADAQSTTRIWMEYSTLPYVNGIQLEAATVYLFQDLFMYGLNPNNMDVYSIFQGLLRKFQSSFVQFSSFRHRMMEEFLCHGADINATLQDTGHMSWVEFLLKLVRICFDPIDPFTDFELLLKHGLDPNLEMNTQTIWSFVLGNIEQGMTDTRLLTNYNYKQTMYRKLVSLFLTYGADPHSKKLSDLLGWGGAKPIFASSDVPYLESLVRQEIDYVASRERYIVDHHNETAKWRSYSSTNVVASGNVAMPNALQAQNKHRGRQAHPRQDMKGKHPLRKQSGNDHMDQPIISLKRGYQDSFVQDAEGTPMDEGSERSAGRKSKRLRRGAERPGWILSDM